MNKKEKRYFFFFFFFSFLFVFSIFIIFYFLKSPFVVVKEPINVKKIADILDDPKKYEGKIVIIKAHPAGWRCPVKYYTSLPPTLSRSAKMIWDNSACIYFNGEIINGSISNNHTYYEPGNETIIVKGRIKIVNGIPYIDKP